MRIPKTIYLALTSDEGFDELMQTFEGSQEIKFEKAQDEVRLYVPGFKNYNTYNSYRNIKSKSKKPQVSGDFVNLPARIAAAIGSKSGFNDLYYYHLRRSKSNKLAYIAAMKDIKRHLRKYEPYKNYESFRECLNRRIRKK
jgi:hypothetical protein